MARTVSDNLTAGSEAAGARVPALAVLALLVTVVAWASAFPGIRAGLEGYGPAGLATLRFAVTALALGLWAAARRRPWPRPRDLPRLALVGFTGITLYSLALNTGELTVSAGSASFIVNTVPIFTALLAMAVLRERLGPASWIAMALSFAGVGLIAVGERPDPSVTPGAGLVLLAAVSQALFFVLQKPLLERYDAVTVTTFAIAFGALFLLPFGLGDALGAAAKPWPATLAVLYLGLVPSAIGYVTWAYALARLPAARAAGALYLVPLVALAIAWVWLGERPTMLALAGGAVVLSGVVLMARLRGR